MFRAALGLGLVAVLVAFTGCTMCCHPYDRCGPVYDQGCSSCSGARAGSILEGGVSESMPAQIVGNSRHNVQTMQAGARGQPRLGLVPGSEKILSVTDRTVTPSAGDGDAPAIAAESATESAKPLPSSGWTARRPTAETQR
jgi:hypothetical protein